VHGRSRPTRSRSLTAKRKGHRVNTRCPFAGGPAPQHNHGALAVISDR
jgi:hypothetical protein